MSNPNTRSALANYKQVGVQSGVDNATPHSLIQMLMAGALEKISAAKGFMERGEIAPKGEHISWAISIIEGLKTSLDKSVGGEIAENLEFLYIYMSRRLMEANKNNDPALLDEVSGLLAQIKSGWDAIPQDIIEKHAAGQKLDVASGS